MKEAKLGTQKRTYKIFLWKKYSFGNILSVSVTHFTFFIWSTCLHKRSESCVWFPLHIASYYPDLLSVYSTHHRPIPWSHFSPFLLPFIRKLTIPWSSPFRRGKQRAEHETDRVILFPVSCYFNSSSWGFLLLDSFVLFFLIYFFNIVYELFLFWNHASIMNYFFSLSFELRVISPPLQCRVLRGPHPLGVTPSTSHP